MLVAIYKATQCLYIHCTENLRTKLRPLLNDFFLEASRKIVSPSMQMNEMITVPQLFTFNEALKIYVCTVSPCECASFIRTGCRMGISEIVHL
jgi:hypothetical protein